MNILHILSQKYLTGAETYVVCLAEQQIATGEKVFIISDAIHVQTTVEVVCMPISCHNYFIRLINVYKLVRFSKKNNIDVLHAHSRASCWIANLAAKIANVGYVATLHDMQKPHLMARLWNIYGKNMIAVCEIIKTDFVTNLKIPEKHIKIIRNGL